jgi:hypothetical protein
MSPKDAPVSMTPGIVRRLLRIALAASILASGGFHFHTSDSLLEGWQARDSGSLLRSTASHPASPLHVESVEVKRAPRCLECLLRQKDHAFGARPCSQPAALVPSVDGAQPALALPLLRRALDPGQPRGPPLV